ncbi:MAG: VanZ family protein [Sphingomonadaceae bacterium]|nr:VanZ family protein [Sphingomonadaceae bacterium]
MALFSSQRERKLWLWVLIVIAAIYATLGVAPGLAGALREYGLLEAVFIAGVLLIALAIAIQGFRTRPRAIEIAVGLAVVAVFILVLVRIELPEERTHLIEYAVVALLIHEALLERTANGRDVPALPLLAIVLTAAVGAIDEGLQYLLPGRVFDLRDIAFNLLAAVIAVIGSTTVSWARQHSMR